LFRIRLAISVLVIVLAAIVAGNILAQPAWLSGFKYRAIVTLKENIGIERESEPVTVTLSVSPGEIKDPLTEVRVVNPEGKEIPFQIHGIKKLDGKIVSFDVTFLANVPANSKVVYVIYFVNPTATKPQYSTDLNADFKFKTVDGFTMASGILSNKYISLKLSDASGEGNVTIGGETLGVTGWLGGVFFTRPPPKDGWFFTWGKEFNVTVVKGPIFIDYIVHFVNWQPEVKETFVHYKLYAGKPLIFITSEWKFNGKQTLDRIATTCYFKYRDNPSLPSVVYPSNGKLVTDVNTGNDRDVPDWDGTWVYVYNEKTRLSAGVIMLPGTNDPYGFRTGGGAVTPYLNGTFRSATVEFAVFFFKGGDYKEVEKMYKILNNPLEVVGVSIETAPAKPDYTGYYVAAAVAVIAVTTIVFMYAKYVRKSAKGG